MNLSVSRIRLILLVLFCFGFLPQTVWAQQAIPSIYIDPSSTDPFQDGTQAHPYHSWREIPNNNPTRIATFYFKRGTRLVWPITIYNPNTTATNFITFDAYGKGTNRLNLAAGTWANEGNGVYSRTVGSTNRNLRAFYVNDAEQQEDYFYAYFVRKGYANIIPKNGPRLGKWIYNAANDKIYWKSTVADPNAALAQWGTETDKPKIIGRIPIQQSAWKGPVNGVYSAVVEYGGIQDFYINDPEDSLEIPYSGGATPPDGYWGAVGNTLYYNPTGTTSIAPSQSQYNTLYWNDNMSVLGSSAILWHGITILKGDYTNIKNVYTKNSGQIGINAPGIVDNITVSYCKSTHNGHSLNEASGGQSDGIGDGINLGGNNVVVSDCEAGFNQDSAIASEAGAQGQTIKKLTITDSWLHENGAHTISAHGYHGGPPYQSVVNGTNLILEKGGNKTHMLNGYEAQDYGSANVTFNYGSGDFLRSVFDSAGGNAFAFVAGVGTTTVKSSLIVDSNFNNYPNYSQAGPQGNESIFLNDTPSPTFLKLILQNNTFYDTTAKNLYQKWASGYFPAVEAKNNIFIAGAGEYNIEAAANPANNPNAIFDHNNIGKGTFLNNIQGTNITDINTWNAKSFVGTDMTTNPLFTNEAGKIFSLQASSPMINAGANVGLSSDILGNPIVGNPDIGAFEYTPGGNTGDPTPPAAPGGLHVVQ